jgi:hypothetical protein
MTTVMGILGVMTVGWWAAVSCRSTCLSCNL